MPDVVVEFIRQQIIEAFHDGASAEERIALTLDFLTDQDADYAEGRRDELVEQVRLISELSSMSQMLQARRDIADPRAKESLFILYVALRDPRRSTERKDYVEYVRPTPPSISKKVLAIAEEELKQAMREARAAERLEQPRPSVGCGTPEPAVHFRGLPIPALNPQHERGASVGEYACAVEGAKLERDARVQAELPLGHSRVGGLPDLPPNIAWPTHKGKKIPFVAQLNLADFAGQNLKLLPSTGQLFAFALADDESFATAVFIHSGAASDLVRAPYPVDDEIREDWARQRVYQILPAAVDASIDEDDEQSLGWLFGETSDAFDTPGELARAENKPGDDWINLLALQSVGSMTWSDVGHLYLLIRKSDLAKLDFGHVVPTVCSS